MPLETRTYQLSSSPWTKPVDLWTLRGVTDSLQDGRFSCVCSSNNEDSERDNRDSGEILLCVHITDVLWEGGLQAGNLKGTEHA